MKYENNLFNKNDLSETEETLLFLVPLVQTAWAHGAIASRERHLIFEAARQDSIDARDPINDTLEKFLVYQPSRDFFDECLSLINQKLSQMTVKERNEMRRKIITRCQTVAASAGDKSPMDLNNHISAEEKFLLERFEEIL